MSASLVGSEMCIRDSSKEGSGGEAGVDDGEPGHGLDDADRVLLVEDQGLDCRGDSAEGVEGPWQCRSAWAVAQGSTDHQACG
eukprot:10888225-Alexandrium_andersonii.AAC.1